MTHITPAQAREAHRLLSEIDPAHLPNGALNTLTAFIQQYEEMEADIKTATSCLSGIREKAQQVDEGIMFSHGSDVLEDISTALEYLRRAAAATKGE